jgi:hypothetical protein
VLQKYKTKINKKVKNKFPFTRRSGYRFGFTIGVILTKSAIIGAGVFIMEQGANIDQRLL